MRKKIKSVYSYKFTCLECNSEIVIYYTTPDFGDTPIIKKCKKCGELYWYSFDDEAYNKPIENQLDGKKCAECKTELLSSLVATHRHILCCNTEITLDDDFLGHTIPLEKEMVQVEVYLLYSE